MCRLKSKGWAKSTSGTYRTHLKTYLEFCGKYDLEPVPCTTKTVELYIAFLVDVKKFAFSSIRSYVNIISVLHKSQILLLVVGILDICYLVLSVNSVPVKTVKHL